MSNIPTSNIKFPTSNSAITLIALIITIIVLLILAGVTLSMVMGESGLFGKANKAKEASHALFAGGGDSAHMPTLELTAADFADGGLDILALLVKAELAPSRSDARRAVQQGGVSVADEKVTDIQTTYGADAFGADGLVVKRGKKKFVKIVVK